MTFIVTDGNVLIADRCVTGTYKLGDNEKEIKWDRSKLVTPEKPWGAPYDSEIITGAFSGCHNTINKIKTLTNGYGNIVDVYEHYLAFSGKKDCPDFLGIAKNGNPVKVNSDGALFYKKPSLVYIGSGSINLEILIKYIPDLTPLETMVLAYRSDDGVSRNFDYWCNGKVTENVTLTEKQENNILDKIQKRFDIRRLNLKE